MHGTGVVNAEDVIFVIDEDVVPGEEVIAEETANGKASSLHVLHVVDENALVGEDVIADLERSKVGVVDIALDAETCDSRVACGGDAELGGERLIETVIWVPVSRRKSYGPA